MRLSRGSEEIENMNRPMLKRNLVQVLLWSGVVDPKRRW